MRKEVAVVAAVSTTLAVVGVVALVRQWRRRKEQELRRARNIVRKFARESATPLNKLWQVADDLVSRMKASLSSHPNESTTLNMLISYVASLPNGEEEGLYYGVNLRGTDLLILRAQLGGKNMPISDLHREQISFPPDVLAGTSQELFDFIAGEVAKFVSAHPENGNGELPKQKKLGFILSYPVEEAEAFSGSVIKWKSFSADDPVGKELVNDLNRALKDHSINMDVFAMVDDTIGDLAGGRYYNRDSVAAITLGMTTNAAYVESPQAAVPRWQHELSNANELVISTEWGNFNSSHLPVTQFDACLDAASSNPKRGIFGKLISGMYLGEIVRLVLLKIAQETSLFGEVPKKLMTPYVLWSPDMAAMHQDTSEDRDVVGDKLNEVFGISKCSAMAREVVAEVCDIVTERAARLAGAGIVAIIKKLERIERRRSVVTVEGGLYDHYRIFRNYLHSSVWEMLGNDLSDNIIIEHSHGGSGTGALFLAASQTHLRNS